MDNELPIDIDAIREAIKLADNNLDMVAMELKGLNVGEVKGHVIALSDEKHFIFVFPSRSSTKHKYDSVTKFRVLKKEIA